MNHSLLRAALIGVTFSLAPLAAQNADLTVIHGIPGLAAPVEVCADGNTLFSFDFGESRGPLSLPPATYNIEVKLQGTVVLSASPTLEADKNYTAVAHLQEGGGISLALFENDISELGRGRSRLAVRHLADAPAVDVYARRFFYNRRIVSDLSNGNEAAIDVRAGRYGVSLTPAGSRTVVFGPTDVDLDPNVVYLVHAIGDLAGGSFQLFLQTIELGGTPSLSATVSGTACGGAIASSTATPQFDVPFDVELSGGTPNGLGLLHMGRSDSRFLFLRLPLDLSVLGATGCTLYQSTDVIRPVQLGANGEASYSVTIPSAVASVFHGLYFQYSFVAPGQNPLGLQLTELLSVEPAGN